MSFDSDPHTPPRPPAQPSTELNDLMGIISAAGPAGSTVQDREKYLEQLRVAIERAKELEVEMALNAGSDVQSPLKSTQPPNNAPGAKIAQQLILHIDDDPATRELVAHVLSDAGLTVISAPSGFDGLDQFRRRPFDFNLVLLDLTMPLMDGEQTFAHLREIRPNVPVILATGFIGEDRLDRLKDVGLAGFIRKPIPPDELVATIRNTLESAKYAGGINAGSGSIVI